MISVFFRIALAAHLNQSSEQRLPLQGPFPKRLNFLLSLPFQCLVGTDRWTVRSGALGEHALPEQITFYFLVHNCCCQSAARSRACSISAARPPSFHTT